jgi:hypothetical protein
MNRILSGFLFLLVTISAVAQTGGGFNLEQNVIGNGGWRSDGGGFMLLGTMGQSNAGSTAAGGGFHLIDGLWAIENPASDSPFASIGGRVVRANGSLGIVRVSVTITNPNTNLSFQTWTQPQGYYSFPNVPTGANYFIKVSHHQFEFNPDSVSVFVSQNRNNIDFVSAM